MENVNSNPFFHIFNKYDTEEVVSVFSKLNESEVELLVKCYGDNFDSLNIEKLSKIELEMIKKIILKIFNMLDNPDLKEADNQYKTRINNSSNGTVTSDIVRDRFMNLPYKKLSRLEQENYMKKLKLSYYNTVDDEKKEEYLAYYKEMFPKWASKYDSAKKEDKQVLLEEAIKNSLEYRNEFIEANMRLVISLAKRYRKYGMFESLCQEGIIGMMNAIERYDFTRGNKFSTYAVYWIRLAIRRYSQSTSSIKIPNHRYEDINKLKRLEEKWAKTYGEYPTREEVMEELGYSSQQYDSIKNARKLLRTRSLDEPITDNDDGVIGDLIADDSTPIDSLVEEKMMMQYLLDIIRDIDLSFRERKIFAMRYGIMDYDRAHKYEEIAREVGVTTQRVKQIESTVKLKIQREVYKSLSSKDTTLDYTTPRKTKKVENPVSLMDALCDLEYIEIRNKLKNVDLSRLDTNSRNIIEAHYALNGSPFVPIKEIAKELGISEQEVSMIEKKALYNLFGSENKIITKK